MEQRENRIYLFSAGKMDSWMGEKHDGSPGLLGLSQSPFGW